jgi:hypothetical protein
MIGDDPPQMFSRINIVSLIVFTLMYSMLSSPCAGAPPGRSTGGCAAGDRAIAGFAR